MEDSRIDKGKILIAEPFMVDPHFKRSVVLLCDHEDEGTVGFILNKGLNMEVGELLPDFPEFKAPVFYGGPVSTDTIHYVHSLGDILDESMPVVPGIFWGGDFDKLKFLIRSGMVKPNDIRFFVGYSGWSNGQLVEELNYGSWMAGDVDPNYLFKNRPHTLWKSALENKGNSYSVIAQMKDPISWN